MTEWEAFLSLTTKLERKNKKVVFRKRAPAVIHAEEKLSYKGTDKTYIVEQFSKNERRKFVAEATLDLHGYTSEEAVREIFNFINRSYQFNRRNLIIITGGNANNSKVLRAMLLSMSKNELAPFISKITSPNDNTGMFLVKLRKHNRE